MSQRAEANSIHCADATSKHACQQLLKYRVNNGNSSNRDRNARSSY
jgi:hypothetical protein